MKTSVHLRLATVLSWIGNIAILGLKIYAAATSQSKAILASLADSAVDIASQFVLSFAEYKIAKPSPSYPVGRAKLEAVAIMMCAYIMIISCIEVIQYSSYDLVDGLIKGNIPELNITVLVYTIQGVNVILKLCLYIYCNSLKEHSDLIGALAEDHLNDVFSNITSLIATIVVQFWRNGWWIDPALAIFISVIIIIRWSKITYNNILKLIGKAAPEPFINEIKEMTQEHHSCVSLDTVRAYHFGAKYIVEVDLIMPSNMTVEDSHDIGLELQHKIENLHTVERAFIHIDYKKRTIPEHKTERNIQIETRD